MKRRILLLMMTALLSVGAWAADDLTLNVGETEHFGNDWGFSKSDNTVTINDWAAGGGWVFGAALSKNDYYGVDFTFGAATTEEVKLIIVYNDATPTTQEIAVPSGSTNIHAVFNTNEDIKKIGFKMSVTGHEGDYSTNITITSAVVKAWPDGNLSIKVLGLNENPSITLGQWATNDTWVFSKTLSQDNYSGIDLTFSETTAKITLQITYANDAVQDYEIPANCTHVAVGFDFNGNISKIGFKHNDYSNGEPVSITITNAVILSSATGDEVELMFANLSNSATNPETGAVVYTKDADTQSITLNCYTWASYWSFAPAISSDDYEKVVITFSEAIPNKTNLNIHAHENSGSDAWNGTQIGTLTGGANKATAYFRNKPGVNIDQLGFYFGYNEGETATTLKIASVKLYKKPQTVTITDAEYATCVTTAATDFSKTVGIKAYIAKVNAAKTKVELTEVTKVAAGVPVILNGSATDYTLHYTTETTDDVTGNELQVSDGTVTGDGSTIYVLAKGTSGVGFYLVENGSAITAGKAYLSVPVGGARQFIGFGDDNGATGITMVQGEGFMVNGSDNYYDLQGRRVAQPTKGLYIVNGKKVVIK